LYLPDAAVQFGNAPLQQLLVMIFLGVFPSALAYMLWAKALMIAQKTSDVTNYMFVTPLLAALMGFLIMGEIPALSTWVGGLMIFTGLLLFKIQFMKPDHRELKWHKKAHFNLCFLL
jgi:drug/metabolite transporter (DMT)-like permease